MKVRNDQPGRGRPAPGRAQALERLFEFATYLTEAMDGELARRGLTRARAEVLWRLARLGPVTQRRLSQELACTPRNVTDLVDALEAAGYVRRESHPTDRRATLVTLTELGRDAAGQMVADYRLTARDLFAGLSPDELTTFATTLETMLATLRRRSRA